MANSLKQPELLDFQVVEEPWNEFKLADGSTLRVKVVLKHIIKEGKESFAFGATNVLSVIPDPKYVGPPSPPLAVGEKLESFIEEEDIEVVSKTELWNEYLLPSEKMSLMIKGVAVLVSRTKRKDEKGLPIYIANIQPLVKPKKRK